MKALARRQLDRRLDRIRTIASDLNPPEGGWVATIRKALGMTQADLGARLGVTQQAIAQMEDRESSGSLTLTRLQEAANAVGGTLVYAILPSRSLSDMLEDRAYRVAREMANSVHHSMRLEDQETAGDDIEARTERIARKLLESPDRLWTIPDGG